mmetsp:Transcript_60965/g.125664  ORF Transcript_60965/g.125664 Transcript_60965/m.125664 type:complete len:215 (-) Transcript_60965:251-895(-)
MGATCVVAQVPAKFCTRTAASASTTHALRMQITLFAELRARTVSSWLQTTVPASFLTDTHRTSRVSQTLRQASGSRVLDPSLLIWSSALAPHFSTKAQALSMFGRRTLVPGGMPSSSGRVDGQCTSAQSWMTRACNAGAKTTRASLESEALKTLTHRPLYQSISRATRRPLMCAWETITPAWCWLTEASNAGAEIITASSGTGTTTNYTYQILL